MSVPFRERNPVVVGAVSLAVIALLLLAAFRADRLPLIGGGETYYANFSEIGGLKAADEVRIAGVRVGKVQETVLDGDKVRVEFQIDQGVEFGPQTGAAIKVKTLLGSNFLALTPSGSGQMEEEATIPLTRTESPYDIVQAFEGLATRAEQIDVDQLKEAVDTLAEVGANTPEEFQGTLRGLSALSANVAKRDAELNTLLRNLEVVSGIIADRDEDLVRLMDDADVLFQALVQRRESISRLLDATSSLSRELTTLVRQSRQDIGPALTNLEQVVDLLLKNQNNLDQSLRLMAPFYRVFTNTLSTGPWFDTWIQNLPPIPQAGG
ncbi:MCE family protein [Alteromonas gracilis]